MNWKNNPTISVIMPFYNCEKYLDEAILSILNQTFSDFEFIIINDASTDSSDEIVQKYLSDTRIVYIKNEKNQWIVKNLNKWIDLAKWEYIARMDWDDISDLSRFEKQLKFLEENSEIDVVSNFTKLIDEKGNEIWEIKKNINSEQLKKDLFLFSPIIHASMMAKTNILKKLKFKEEYLYAEDYELWFRIIFWWGKMHNIPEFLYYYRKHENSSSKNNKIVAKICLKIRKDAIKKYNLKVWLKWYVWMYVHFILGYFLSWKQKEKLEHFIKRFIVKN